MPKQCIFFIHFFKSLLFTKKKLNLYVKLLAEKESTYKSVKEKSLQGTDIAFKKHEKSINSAQSKPGEILGRRASGLRKP